MSPKFSHRSIAVGINSSLTRFDHKLKFLGFGLLHVKWSDGYHDLIDIDLFRKRRGWRQRGIDATRRRVRNRSRDIRKDAAWLDDGLCV